MWIFTIAPEWIFHMIVFVGITGTIAGFVLGFIPIINKYKMPIQIISILILLWGIFLQGALADNKIWQMRVKEMEVKVAEAQAEAAKKNVEIQEKIIYKTQVVRERGKDIIKYVDREVVKNQEVIKFIENCPAIPQEIINQHNAAAIMNEAASGAKK